MIGHIVARYGEISLKGNNRSDFERALQHNAAAVLKAWPDVRVARSEGRLLVTLHGAPVDAVLEQLKRVFGIVSLSPVTVVSLDLADITAAATQALQAAASMLTRPDRTFKIDARRTNKQYPLTSMDIARVVGGDVLEASPGWRVDVHDPVVTLYIEIRSTEAFVYSVKIPATGGMPGGTAGRVGLLLSGGIDSPVAGWLSMRRGVSLEAIHFHSFPFTSERALQKVETLAQTLADWSDTVYLHTVHFTEVQTAIRRLCPEPLYITIMRRFMLRIADEIARRRGLLALATGESLGQVASQTLESMHVINAVTTIPVLRPLIMVDKVDIIRQAREIGTYETSILPYEDCCTIFVPKRPRTRPTLREAEAAEEQLPVAELVAEAVERTTIKHFTPLDRL